MTTQESVVTCPHCNSFVSIEQLNCAIFRHGTFKSTDKQIPPHSSKVECDRLAKNGLIYGCGKPFKVLIDATGCWTAVVCDYV